MSSLLTSALLESKGDEVPEETFYHVSGPLIESEVLRPRIPSETTLHGGNPEIEDATTPRVNMAQTLEGAINAILWGEYHETLKTNPITVQVYKNKEPIDVDKIIWSDELTDKKLVFDAYATTEIWVMVEVPIIHVGEVTVAPDDIKEIVEKPNFNVSKKETFSYFTINNLPDL